MSEPQIRVLLADDHEIILEMLGHFLEKVDAFHVTTTTSLQGAMDAIAQNGKYDVVLLDYDMPGMNGMEGLSRCIKANAPNAVALLTGNAKHGMVQEVIDLGGMGILTKHMSGRSLENAIRLIWSGSPFVPLSLMKVDDEPEKKPTGILTAREMTVLENLGEGLSNKEIASVLHLAEATVKMHVQSVCRKLEAKNRTMAVVHARDQGLL